MNPFEIYLNQEELKIREADRLLEDLLKVWFGAFNPRWWKVKKELDKVVMSFKPFKGTDFSEYLLTHQNK